MRSADMQAAADFRPATFEVVSASHRNRPIGIFDSGVGGLTVVSEIFNQLPREQVVYFGDTGRFPYGIRSADVIRRFSRQNVNFLLEQGVKMVVVACNTASAHALDYIRQIYNVPMVGVIEPGARAAVKATVSRRIGVIGTEGTIASQSYTRALKSLDFGLNVYGLACPLFVALVESGYIDKKATYMIAQDYLAELKKRKIDTLVLGCTHYPPLKKVIGKVMGPAVRLIDSADETARAVKEILSESGMTATRRTAPVHRYFVSDTPERLKKMARIFLDRPIGKVTKIDIDLY